MRRNRKGRSPLKTHGLQRSHPGARRRTEARRRREAEAEARREAELHPIVRYWDGLTVAQRSALQEEALAQADPWLVEHYQSCLETKPSLAKYYLQPILDKHISRLLATRRPPDGLG